MLRRFYIAYVMWLNREKYTAESKVYNMSELPLMQRVGSSPCQWQ